MPFFCLFGLSVLSPCFCLTIFTQALVTRIHTGVFNCSVQTAVCLVFPSGSWDYLKRRHKLTIAVRVVNETFVRVMCIALTYAVRVMLSYSPHLMLRSKRP